MEQSEQSRLASLAINCASTRRAYQAARKALKEHFSQHGGCQYADVESGGPCYQQESPVGEWCEKCCASEPLYHARIEAGEAAGRAFRALLAACRKAE